MSRALIIGAGGVAGVVIHKCCQNSEVFTDICIASRTKSKCDKFKEELQDKTKTNITTAQVNADNVPELVALMKEYKPDICINVALPYQDLHIMDACLECKVDYVDTANYEPEDTAKFEYKWQWAYRERFEKAGITALLGSGFDPGVTGVFCAYAQKHYFDEINYIDILDCNGGDHGYPFATNFNPEITDAAEIMRLKKELATLRSILRSYVHEIDSLNRVNEQLRSENQQVKAQYTQATQTITNLSTEKETLSEKVAIASQLDATGISMVGQNKRGKKARKVKDVKKFVVSFVIARNITAQAGNRSIYVRITKPNNEVLTNGGTFVYENRNLEYSAKKDIEYNGEATSVTVYWDVNEFLSKGTYRVSVFADGHNIGNASFNYEK